MTTCRAVGLGTVQFGMHYGVSNHGGPAGRARGGGDPGASGRRAVWRYLDTASAYGDAEILLGRHLPAGHHLRIVTKTAAGAGRAASKRGTSSSGSMRLRFRVDRLKVYAVYGLLVHQSRRSGQARLAASRRGLAGGAVARPGPRAIGVSIYDDESVGARRKAGFVRNLVQLPLNALDRRPIVSGTLARLKAAGSRGACALCLSCKACC